MYATGLVIYCHFRVIVLSSIPKNSSFKVMPLYSTLFLYYLQQTPLQHFSPGKKPKCGSIQWVQLAWQGKLQSRDASSPLSKHQHYLNPELLPYYIYFLNSLSLLFIDFLSFSTSNTSSPILTLRK